MYNKEDPDCPVFIPNAVRSGQENAFPTEDKPVNIGGKVMQKRQQKDITSCKEPV